jgi:hypothetical protein
MHHFRQLSRFILIGLALLGLFVSSAQAALVTEIRGLGVFGTMYDVTFHRDSSFDDLWPWYWENEGEYNPTMAFNGSAPMFWDDSSRAVSATRAIMAYLGDTHWTAPSNVLYDGFFVPFSACSCDLGGINGTTFTGVHKIYVMRDLYTELSADSPYGHTWHPFWPAAGVYASFQEVSAVPVPASVWLFGTALIGLVGFSKRKSGIAA